jgi:hypothetical protein
VCPDGLAVCGLACRDLDADTSCGSCDEVCPEGGSCIERVCECPGVMPGACGGVCVDHASDAARCGDCDTACARGASCVSGRCRCDVSGQASCAGVCVDVGSDETNCGRCGTRCPAGASCAMGSCACDVGELCSGVCVDVTSTPTDCGGCGRACAGDQLCERSACRPELVYDEIARSDRFATVGDRFTAVDVDDRGGVVWARSSIDASVVVSAYDAAGASRWSRTISATTYDLGGVCVEPGAHHVALVFWGSRDVSVRLLDDAGTLVWSRDIEGTGRMRAGNCAFSGAGELVVGGTFGGPTVFGTITRTGDTDGDAFLATYRVSDGADLHVATFGTSTSEAPLLVAVAPDGDRVVTGETGGLSLTLAGTIVNGPFVARLASDDTVRWARDLPFEEVAVRRIGRPAVDSLGNVYVGGLLVGSSSRDTVVSVLGLSYTVRRYEEATLLLAMDRDGTAVWLDGVRGSYALSTPSVAVGGGDRVFFVGQLYGSSTDVGGAFVRAYDAATMRLRWSRLFDGRDTDEARDVAARGDTLAIAGERLRA